MTDPLVDDTIDAILAEMGEVPPAVADDDRPLFVQLRALASCRGMELSVHAGESGTVFRLGYPQGEISTSNLATVAARLAQLGALPVSTAELRAQWEHVRSVLTVALLRAGPAARLH